MAQRAHFAAQLAQLLALTRHQRLTLTVVDFRVLHPVAERLVGDPQVLGDAGQGALTAADEAHCLGFELRRIGRLGAGHGNTSSWASCPMIECPPKGGNSSMALRGRIWKKSAPPPKKGSKYVPSCGMGGNRESIAGANFRFPPAHLRKGWTTPVIYIP